MRLLTAAGIIFLVILSPAFAGQRHLHHRTPPVPSQSKILIEGRWCVSGDDGHVECQGTVKTAVRPPLAEYVSSPFGNCPQYLGCGCHLANRMGGIARFGHKLWRQLWVARNWTKAGTRVGHGCIDCVAVFSRGRGGHVGIVKGYDSNGNPIVYSWGNRRVQWFTKTYSRHRVLGYVEIADL